MNVRVFGNNKVGTDFEVSGTPGSESSLDVPCTIRGQVVVAFSASFRRHWRDGKENGCGGVNGQGAELSFMAIYEEEPVTCAPSRAKIE
jgi:hypothetical protein